jgi:hypothetical protein
MEFGFVRVFSPKYLNGFTLSKDLLPVFTTLQFLFSVFCGQAFRFLGIYLYTNLLTTLACAWVKERNLNGLQRNGFLGISLWI